VRLLSSRRLGLGLKVAAFSLLLGVGVGLGWMLWRQLPLHKITDQELLREAVAEWKKAGEPGYGPNYQIFEQQAAQGYYEDAEATGRQFKRADDVQWSIVELVKIRAENGDIEGAKNSVKSLSGSAWQKKGAGVVALIQAQNGDLSGALETIAPFGECDEIFLAYGRRQIEIGDFEGALDTAARTKSGYQLFYDIGAALRARGQQSRVRKLAAHVKDRKFAALFLECARFTLRPHPEEVEVVQATPCEDAYLDATRGQFAEADEVIRKNGCSNVSFVAVHQYEVDPSGAERLLRDKSDSQDLAFGLGQFAAVAARKGNIAEALRLLNDVQSVNLGEKNKPLAEARVTDAIYQIARAWTIKSGPKAVLRWARSRPTTEQRTWALIGMAEALGHATPGRHCL
jgi:tetratricopeptide (TPR) repeat protein